jgi:hypothetical protein
VQWAGRRAKAAEHKPDWQVIGGQKQRGLEMTFVAALARHLEAVPPAWDAA